jgi:methyl coenzyme M reductase gamma subunit
MFSGTGNGIASGRRIIYMKEYDLEVINLLGEKWVVGFKCGHRCIFHHINGRIGDGGVGAAQ